MSSLALGAFDLGPRLAEGGMAVVHRGTHRATGAGVAVKLVTSASTPRHRASLRSEVRQAALLDHPGIIRIHEHGELPGEAAAWDLVPGTPWVVMDLLEGGSVADRPPGDWAELREVLVQLLGALGHAHARGLIHRDLKPDNALRASSGRVVLTDFGIATAEGVRLDGSISGTPWVMAPEQCSGAWRDFGPWTDLYALGCTTWWLACGQPPFATTDPISVLRDHLHSPLPELRPRFGVPPDLERWLALLLAKHPLARFRCAADAAFALERLTDPIELKSAPVPLGALDSAGATWADLDEMPAPAPEAIIRPDVPFRQVPAQPRSPGPRGFPDAGLTLLGLRELPLIGRSVEWERLRSGLGTAAETKRVQTMWLHGPAGAGKSWLVQRFAELAVEHGSALFVRATHDLVAREQDGVCSALLRFLHCEGLPIDAAVDRVEARCARSDTPRSHLEALVHSPSEAARQAAAWRVLLALAEERPVILVLEGAHLAGEAQALIRRASGRQGAVLVVATSTEPPPEGLPVEPVPLERLPDTDTRRLLQAVVGLRSEALDELAQLAGGLPVVAVQVAEELAASGRLVPGAGGFTMESGPVRLPGDVWTARLDGLVRSDREWDALELAAALGSPVNSDEWARACRGLELDLGALTVRLEEARLARTDPTGWTFRHALLVEALRDRSRERGTWSERNATCALAVTGEDPTALVRRGLHRLEAGDLAGAMDPLVEGALGLGREDRLRERARLLRRWEAVVLDSDIELLDPSISRGWMACLAGYSQVGWLSLAEQVATRLLQAMEASGTEHPIDGDVYKTLAKAARAQGQYERSVAWAERAMARRETCAHPESVAYELAQCLRWKPEGRARALELLHEVATTAAHAEWQSSAHLALGTMYQGSDEMELAATHFGLAREGLDPERHVARLAMLEASLAQLEADRGDLEAARTAWEHSVEVTERLGQMAAPICRLNLAMILLRMDAPGEADAHAARARDLLVMERPQFEGFALGVLCATSARQGLWTTTREHLARLRAILDEGAPVEGTMVDALELAADAAPDDLATELRAMVERIRAAL